MELSAAIDLFGEHLRVERGLAKNTLLAYTSDLKICWEYLTDKGARRLKVEDISPLYVKDFLAHLRDDRHFQARSLARAMSSLRQFFDFCRLREWIPSSPAVSLQNPKTPRKLPVYLVGDEIPRLLQAPDRSDPEGYRDYAILLTMLYTGLRLSEIVGLNIEDFDFGTPSVRVLGKGSKERLLPLHGKLVEVLQTYIDGHRPACSLVPAPLFLGRGDRRMTARAVGWAVERAVKRAGVSHRITPHKLRHTFATQLLHKGASLLEIKELLGHSQLATTSIYTHTNVERLRRAVDKIKV